MKDSLIMARCPECECEDYETMYIEDYDYDNNRIIALVKVKCDNCGKEFWIKEKFKFENSTNVSKERKTK